MSKQKIVLVTGVFDVIHKEHIKFLKKSKAIGDHLIVGVESDKRVKQIKGEERPINSAEVRVKNLENLKIADEVFVLPEQFSKPEDHVALIGKIRPDYLAVSSHTGHLDKKQVIMDKFGGKVVIVHQHNPKVSTTKLLSK